MVEIDKKFAMKNYKYIVDELHNQKLKEIYQLLGPLNYDLNIDRDETWLEQA